MAIVINGAGKLGREIIRQCTGKGISIAAINDASMSADTLVYLLQYDTTYYGKNNALVGQVEAKSDDEITIDGKSITLLHEQSPEGYSGGDFVGNTVIECTGTYTTQEKLQAFINIGAARVIAPYLVNGLTPAIVNVNEKDADSLSIYSTGTADLAALCLVSKIANDYIGIENATSLTLSAYDNRFSLSDYPDNKTLSGGRAAAQNMIPMPNFAAATAVKRVLPELDGKFTGQVCYTAVLAGSLSYVRIKTGKARTLTEIVESFREAASGEYSSSMVCVDAPVLPSDVLTLSYHAVVPLPYIKASDSDGYEWTIAFEYDAVAGFAAQNIYMADSYGTATQSVSETYESIKSVDVSVADNYVTNLRAYVELTNRKLAVTTALDNAEDATAGSVDMNFYNEVCEFLESLEA